MLIPVFEMQYGGRALSHSPKLNEPHEVVEIFNLHTHCGSKLDVIHVINRAPYSDLEEKGFA